MHPIKTRFSPLCSKRHSKPQLSQSRAWSVTAEVRAVAPAPSGSHVGSEAIDASVEMRVDVPNVVSSGGLFEARSHCTSRHIWPQKRVLGDAQYTGTTKGRQSKKGRRRGPGSVASWRP